MSLESSGEPRRIAFEYPDDMAPIWTPGRPEFSCAANSVSMMMPAIEPYFVRSIRSALPQLSGSLRGRTEAYLDQESQHHRQHVLFNRMLVKNYGRLGLLDRLVKGAYRRLESLGSQQFNIGFAAGSETMAYSAARWAEQHRKELFTGAHQVPTTLFLWHLAEEVEHKSVAFDVYWHLYAGRPLARARYAGATAISLSLLVAFVVGGTALMLLAERRLHNPLSWYRLIRWSITFAFELLSNLIVSMLPGHHPSDFADPLWYEVWLQEFDAESATMPVWRR